MPAAGADRHADAMTDEQSGAPTSAHATTTAPPPGGGTPPGPRRYRRSREDRMVAGVCGGLAETLAIDPVVLRVLLTVLMFFGGAGIAIYIACWLLMPDDDRESSLAERALAGERLGTWSMIGLAALVGLATVVTLGAFLDHWVALAAGVVVLVAVLQSRRGGPGPGGGGPRTHPGAGPGGHGVNLHKDQPPVGPPTGIPGAGAPQPPQPPDRGSGTAGPRPGRQRSILGRLTFSTVLLALGALGTADLLGADVPAPAYPAVVVAGAALGLLVGARYGRARSLIALGLLGALAIPPAAFAEEYDGDWVGEETERIAPGEVAAIEPEYSFRGGRILIDLGEVDFDGATTRTEVRLGAGDLEITVPPEVDVDVDLSMGAGTVTAFGDGETGLGPDLRRDDDGVDGAGGGQLDLTVDQGFGRVEVLRAAA